MCTLESLYLFVVALMLCVRRQCVHSVSIFVLATHLSRVLTDRPRVEVVQVRVILEPAILARVILVIRHHRHHHHVLPVVDHQLVVEEMGVEERVVVPMLVLLVYQRFHPQPMAVLL